MLVRIILSGGVLYFLWRSFQTSENFLEQFASYSWRTGWLSYTILLIPIVLLPVNWLLEARKWLVIAGKEHLSMIEAIEGVLMGLSLDNLLPFGTGAISGRLMSLATKSRTSKIPGILLGQTIQSLVTFTFGLFGFWIVWHARPDLFAWKTSYTILILGCVPAVVAIIYWRDKIQWFIRTLGAYKSKSWMAIGVLSIVRYLVFLLQFIALIYFFEPKLSLMLATACATWVFAARTFMPKVSNLERLGIRALAVILFAKVIGSDPSGLLMAVTLLWLINLAIPSLVGIVFLSRIKQI